MATTLPPVKQTHSSPLVYPHESQPHTGTLMTWPTAASISPSSNINATRAELAHVARTISRHEPVQLFVHHDDVASAQELLADESAVHVHPTAAVFSLWARDTGPVWVRLKQPTEGDADAPDAVAGVLLHFNNWGAKLPSNADAETAAAVLSALSVPSVSAACTAEGGGLEFDGEGTLLATESCLINTNRNRRLSREQLEAEFARLFAVEKTIWLEGSKGTDITDCHIDALARFVRPGVVLLSRPRRDAEQTERLTYESAKSVLMEARDVRGRRLKVLELAEPEDHAVQEGERQDYGSELCVSYLNYYVCNGAVVMPAFGDEKADHNAKEILAELFPERVVEQVALRELSRQGGGVHCATQQILGRDHLD